jgi:OOP family OmpA-OmpF porin
MNNFNFKLRTIVWACLAVATLGVQAQTSIDNEGLYVGIGAGDAKAKFNHDSALQNALAAGVVAGPLAVDQQGHAYKVFVGFPMSPFWALETGYFNLGRFGFNANTTPDGTVNGRAKVQGLNLDLVGKLPITDSWSLLGRVGMTYAETQGQITGTGAGDVALPSTKKRDTLYKYGFGTQYAFTPALTLRLEAERYRVNDLAAQKSNVDLISVGLVYRFGAPAAKVQPTQAAYVAPAPVYRPEPAPQAAPAPVPAPVAVAAPAPVVVPAPVPVAAPKPWMKVKLSADSLFGFDQDQLQDDGKKALDKLLVELQGVNVDAVQVTGHTDRLGAKAYNDKLSTRRAEAVRQYLIHVGGMPASKVSATGMGSSQPETAANDCKGLQASQALITCLRVDRRVGVEVLGSQQQR